MANQRLEGIAQLLKPIALAPLCENPLISVLTVNRNYARYLGEAIESVLRQTYTNFEMIVCDDGSTDDSCEVAEHYVRRDPRVRLVRKQNGGQVSAANAAYLECKGQVVCFLDSDDRFLPEKLERVVEAFRSHAQSGYAGHRVFRTDAAGCREGVIPSISIPPSGWYGPFVVRYGAPPCGLAGGSAMSLRREISDLIFPVPERFKSGPDVAVMALAPLMTPIIGISTPLTEYRLHGRNHSMGESSPHNGSESVDCGRLSRSILLEASLRAWEASREYLGKVDPVLCEVFPSFDERPRQSIDAYLRARLQTRGGALSAYRDLLRAEAFLTLRPVVRLFWRLSILMPRPVFRYALGPNRLKQLFWWTVEARRRFFASRESVRRAAESHWL
jgi:glycosyltransferase involved in cell wall biosynthesis